MGFSEVSNGGYTHYCPCATASGGRAPPFFVGDDYYCESGYAVGATTGQVFYTSDPLWDGDGCVYSTTLCCADVDLPCFSREFHMVQADDIEVRICVDEPFNIKAIAVDQLQLFVL